MGPLPARVHVDTSADDAYRVLSDSVWNLQASGQIEDRSGTLSLPSSLRLPF